MVKSELAKRLAEHFPDLRHDEAERTVDAILGRISERVAAGDRAELRGFGTFMLRTTASRMHRNPRTGETFPIGERQYFTFKSSRKLAERLNPGLPSESPAHALSRFWQLQRP